MAELSKYARREIKFNEGAVEGLFAGLLAGLGMDAFLTVTALLPSEKLGALFSRFNPIRGASSLAGFLLQLAVSSAYGVVFGIIWYLSSTSRHSSISPLQAAALGMGYGVVLLFLARYACI